MRNYEDFPIQSGFRDELIAKLGLITLAEQHLPEVITEGLYDKTVDELRAATEEALLTGRAEYEGLQIEVEHE